MSTFGLLAGLASVLGLVVGIGTWIQAWRASKAAQNASEVAKEARDAVLVRTLADEFQIACNKMDDLLDLLLHDRFAEAIRVAHELTSALSEIPYRRSPYLGEDNQNELLSLRTQVQEIEEQISPYRDQPVTAKKKQKLVQVCRQSCVNLKQILGTIKKRIEVGGSPWQVSR